MSKQCYNLNRPFHLARRDVFYETAVEAMRHGMGENSAQNLRRHMETALYCLHSAFEHGSLAQRAQRASADEKPFLLFLKIMLERLRAGQLMIQANRQWARENSPLRRFLADQPDPPQIPPSAIQTSIPEVFREMLMFVRGAAIPINNLQSACIGKFSTNELARYEKAAANLRTRLAETSDYPRPKMFYQSAYPIPGMIEE